MAAFAEALAKYDHRRNTRLGSLAMPLIKWRIKDCVRDWRRRGQAGATKADRFLLSHSDATVEQVVSAVVEFMVADRTLRRAIDVLFLESVTAASSMLH